MIPNNLGDNLVLKDLKANASVVATGVSAAQDLLALQDEIAVLLDISAPVAGSSPTLTCKLTHCDTSGGSYTDVTGGSFTAAGAAGVSEKISLNKNELKRYVKLDMTIGGTMSPQYYVSAKILGMSKYG